MAKKTRKLSSGFSFFGKKKSKTKSKRRSSSIKRSAAIKLQRQFRKKRVARVIKTQRARKSKCLMEYNRCMGYSSNRSS